jgi:PBSX family phage terminase large subunit
MPADLKVHVKLRGAARQALSCRDDEVLLAGPAGTGKSFVALLKLHLMCMKNPGMRALMVRKTHKSLTSTGLVTFREQVAKEAIDTGICRWYGGSGEKPAQYIYSNGSVIVVGGLDQVDKVMSAEYDVIFVQEATDCTKDDWEKLGTRLRNGVVSFQQLIADCNPQQPTHWLKQRADEGKTTMLYSRHQDNPRIYDEAGQVTEYGRAYLGRLEGLSGVRKERLLHGRWAAAEGLIYDQWNPAVHISDRKKLPTEWPRIWSVDFGFTHPFVWQQWAIDLDGRMWLELEIYRTQTMVEDHAKLILSLVKNKTGRNIGAWKYGGPPRAIVCDWDAEGRATLERELEMSTTAAIKNVADGIQNFQARLRIRDDGKPRLYVLRDSLVERDSEQKEAGLPTCFSDEIEGYVWEPDPRGLLAKDRPLKERDDSMDCARYAAAYEDLGQKPGIRGWL